MNLANILVNQLTTMLLLMGVGFVLKKRQFLTKEMIGGFSKFLLSVIMPFTLISAFIKPFEVSALINLLNTFWISILSSLIAIIIPLVIYKREGKEVECFSVAFSNVSFMGLPLVQALLGTEYMFFMAAYIAVFNLLIWTVGVFFLTGDVRDISLDKVLKNPNVIAVIIGFIIFLFPIKPHSTIVKAIGSIGGMSTGFSMILIGAFLADCDFGHILKSKLAWITLGLRLFVAPLLSLVLVMGLGFISNEIKLLIIIAACTPTATSAAVMSHVYGKDATYAAGIVSLTTVISVVSMPLVILISQLFIKI